MKRHPMPLSYFRAHMRVIELYEAADRAARRTATRAELYRRAAAAQRQAEAVEALERHTKQRRKAA